MKRTKEGLPIVSAETMVSTLVSLGMRPPYNLDKGSSKLLENRFKKMKDENPELGDFTSKLAKSVEDLDVKNSKFASNMFKFGVVLTYEALRRQGEAYEL